jgi:hypothetical protein
VPSGLANLDPQVRLLKPGDGSYGQNFRGQAIQTLIINDNVSLVNNTLIRYINRHTKSSYFYSELIDPAFSIENRTELHINFDVPIGSASTNVKGYEKDGHTDAKTPITETTRPEELLAAQPGIRLRFSDSRLAIPSGRHHHAQVLGFVEARVYTRRGSRGRLRELWRALEECTVVRLVGFNEIADSKNLLLAIC